MTTSPVQGYQPVSAIALEAATKAIYEDKGDRKGVLYIGWDNESEEIKAQWREDVQFSIEAYLEALPAAPVAQCDARSVESPEEDWRGDPAADERWNTGCDFAMEQLCNVLGVVPNTVSWDAATETLDGDVQSVIGNIMRAKYGEDWPASLTHPTQTVGREETTRTASNAVREALEQFREYTEQWKHHDSITGHINLRLIRDALAKVDAILSTTVQGRDAVRAALKPFAEGADYYDDANLSPGEHPWRDDHPANPVFKVGQLRAARAAIAHCSTVSSEGVEK